MTITPDQLANIERIRLISERINQGNVDPGNAREIMALTHIRDWDRDLAHGLVADSARGDSEWLRDVITAYIVDGNIDYEPTTAKYRKPRRH